MIIELSAQLKDHLVKFQRNEITEHHIYKRLAEIVPSAENRQVLEKISQDELRHYQNWQKYTGQEVDADPFAIWK